VIGKNLDEGNTMPGFRISLLILVTLLISSCSTSTPPATPEIVTVYSTAAAEPWLSETYDCAGSSAIINRVDDPSAAMIALHVGEPKVLSPAYQIDTEEILVVTHRQSPVNNLTREEAQAFFAGRGDPSVQVWVYAAGEDVQDAFDQFVMQGRSVTSSAHIAVNPEQMAALLVNEPNTVGILPGHWKTGDSRVVYTVANIPVLATTQKEPQGVVKDIIACLQK
jgi:hypothetical protein